MPANTALRIAIGQHYFNNIAHANVGDAAGLPAAATAGTFFIGLHTADPGLAGNQSTSETAYTGYVRQTVPRSAIGFSATTNVVSNAAIITFPTCTAAPGAALTHFSIGFVTGAGTQYWSGALTASYQPAIGNAINVAIGAMTTTIT
jgi:hypothetical protein